MGQRRVKWGQAERFFRRRGYDIHSAGGEKIIVAPKTSDTPGSRQSVRIGHKSCNHAGSELLRVYLSKFNTVFGVSIEDILDD